MVAKALVFDVDDTLYDLAGPYRVAYAEVFGSRYDLPVEELFKVSRVHSDEALELLTAGKISEEDHKVLRVQWTLADWGVHVSREEALVFQEAYARAQRHIALYPEAVEMLDACASASVPLGIISNGDAAHQFGKMRLLGLERWFARSHMVASGELGAHKPATAPFMTMERLLGASGAGIWYVGDTYETDVVGAKRVGWSSLWLDIRGREVPSVPESPDVVVHSPREMCDAVKSLLRPCA